MPPDLWYTNTKNKNRRKAHGWSHSGCTDTSINKYPTHTWQQSLDTQMFLSSHFLFSQQNKHFLRDTFWNQCTENKLDTNNMFENGPQVFHFSWCPSEKTLCGQPLSVSLLVACLLVKRQFQILLIKSMKHSKNPHCTPEVVCKPANPRRA